MFIGHESIAGVLESYSPKVTKADTDFCLTGFEYLSGALLPYTEHVLYIVRTPEELKQVSFIPYMNFLIFNPEKKDLSQFLDPQIPVNYTELFLTEDAKIPHMLRSYFNDVNASGLMADTVLSMIFHDSSIQDMLDAFTRGFNNPVFVFDAGYHLLAVNKEMAMKDARAKHIIDNMGFTEEDFKLLNRGNMPYERIRKSELPVRVFHEELGYEQMICTIDARKDMGHIVISAVNRPFNDTDTQLMVMLKEGIHQQLIKQDFVRNNEGFPYEYFIKDLLDGKLAVDKQAYGMMDYVNSVFTDNMYCLVVETARSSKAMNLFRIRSEFETAIQGTKTMMYNGEIIVLLSLPGELPLQDADLKKLQGICSANELYAGLSNHFTSCLDISAYYKQALRAIELGTAGNNQPGLYIYGDYYMKHVINIFSQKTDTKAFCSPKLQVLLEHDEKNGTELAYSLYMYLIHERNSITASEAMFIHRNTLMYRLKKIDSLVNIDYNNYEERRYLILSYEMLK